MLAVALVTGAAQGIGLAVAQELSRQGLAVVIADLNAALAEQAAAGLRVGGGQALALEVDVSKRESVDHIVQEVLSRFGRIDVLINNAGIAGRAVPLTEVTEEE